jgi:hypothetical protein
MRCSSGIVIRRKQASDNDEGNISLHSLIKKESRNMLKSLVGYTYFWKTLIIFCIIYWPLWLFTVYRLHIYCKVDNQTA